MNDKISVIIPVYNVAPYLEKCLDSVCGQTYPNLEIIVVDDGSTDLSGKICDEYALRDPRIVVIHKENGGLADARNVGLSVAGGAYIGFVDSDDWIEKDMYERLYRLCEENNLDLVTARFREERMDCTAAANHFTDEFVLLDRRSLLQSCVAGNQKILITNSVWDRLYKKSILEGLSFPKGKCYEDVCFTINAFLRVQKAGHLDSMVYHYRIREDSIMGKGVKNKILFSDNIISDLLPLMKERAEILQEAGFGELSEESFRQYLMEILHSLTKIYHVRQYAPQYGLLKKEFRAHKKWIKRHVKNDMDKRRKLILKVSNASIETYILAARAKQTLSGLLERT